MTSANEAVPGVFIRLQESLYTTISRDDGSFIFAGTPPGEYTLVASRLGLSTVIQRVSLKERDTLFLRITLQQKPIDIEPVVVTGTRTAKTMASSPVRTEIVSRAEITQSGFIDLADALQEQPGLALIQDHGTGIQLQGLDPAYTLILIDGEPLIGRTAGTLDLSRISVGNVSQIEIVKGPSSSLYGSEALAGVINVLTQRPGQDARPFSGDLHLRYGSLNSWDMGGSVGVTHGDLAASLFIERKSSDGYDLTPESPSATGPSYVDHTILPRFSYQLDSATTVALDGRLYRSTTENTLDVTGGGTARSREETLDWNVSPAFTYRFSTTTKLKGRIYAARYENTISTELDDPTANSVERFAQRYVKAEAQLDAMPSASHIISLGSSYVMESVAAARIEGESRNARSVTAYAQHEWIPWSVIDIIASGRFDSHSDYASRLSPKLALLVSPLEWLKIRLSVGSGFKAPTFQQLYLDFSNPAVGYSVFGSTNVRAGLARLGRDGQIRSLLVDPATLTEIKPEHSFAFNGGVRVTLFGMSLDANVFRNDVTDLIETAPIATKTNGQSVFTYFNLHRVVTQGLEMSLETGLWSGLSGSIAYQYLDTYDREALEAIRQGKISKTGATGRVRPVQEVEYGGLFNRSRHSGSVRLGYQNDVLGFGASLRCILRGRYGAFDRNGNTVLDDDTEYAPAYALWNIALSQRVIQSITLQAGVENILNTTMPEFVPSLPGRKFFGSILVNY